MTAIREMKIEQETTTSHTITVIRDVNGRPQHGVKVSNFGSYDEPRAVIPFRPEPFTRVEFEQLVGDVRAAFDEYEKRFGG